MIKRFLFAVITQKPLTYAISYLVMIPAFAVIYSYVPNMYLEHTKTSCSFWANLYYSVVTITTLGYGDIVPKNTETQMVAASESVLGVVLIGLFLNSIAQHISKKSTIDEKKAQEINRIKLEALKLHNTNKIVELNIKYYLLKTIPVTTPWSKQNHLNPKGELVICSEREDEDTVNEAFTFNDMQDLYHPTLQQTDSFFVPSIFYYYHHQDNLISAIKDLIYHVDLRLWPELEALCIDFLSRNKELDYSGFIKEQPNINHGSRKGSEVVIEMIKNYEGDVKYDDYFSILNPYIALYFLIKSNLVFIKQYRDLVNKIVLEHLTTK